MIAPRHHQDPLWVVRESCEITIAVYLSKTWKKWVKACFAHVLNSKACSAGRHGKSHLGLDHRTCDIVE